MSWTEILAFTILLAIPVGTSCAIGIYLFSADRRQAEFDLFIQGWRRRIAQEREEFLQPKSAWHTVLGVDKDATLVEIESAYKKLIKKLHPDSAPDGKGDEIQFQKALAAYRLAKIAVKNRPTKAQEKSKVDLKLIR